MPPSRASSVLVLLLLGAAALVAQQFDEVSLPTESRPLTVAPGARAVFTIVAATNDFLHVVIDRESPDVAVRLTAPDGTTMNVADRVRAQTYIDLLMLIDRAGVYRLELSVGPTVAGPRRADAHRAALRPATAIDGSDWPPTRWSSRPHDCRTPRRPNHGARRSRSTTKP